ncbi:JAB domain-containing protein [Nocardia asteroides]|uniref:JAB domain-containing protein n=1 Tax=Nocardia asteroides TaxID=1824 RepID=UPI001E5A87CA|nr:DNA repair protein RadC [Nocardia asteroides]UGT53633.1 DNA repair protein RadC [Nocardia asteroides]
MSVPIAHLPAAQRPRERLLLLGPHALSDGELLALLLGQGTRGLSALELAAQLLGEYGGLAELAAARPEELARRAGIGPAKAATVIAAFHLGTRSRTTESVPQLSTPADIARVAVPLFAGARVERLLVLICDAQNRLRHRAFVAEGAIDHVAVPVREVLNTVLRHDGRAFAVIHNHPSGDPTPSTDDRRASTLLATAATTVGLRYLDHLVIAGESWSTAQPLD